MPGFPIRTSSDQRFIDNSPRLNAALHVLHRLSMPRHPPCALNNEHTTNHTQQQHKVITTYAAGVNYTKHKRTEITQTTHPPPTNKRQYYQWQACSLMLASTIQFSHNTPHHNHHQATRLRQCVTSMGYNQGIMPQTPNNAPTYKQILFSNCARHCVSQSAIQTLGLCLKGVSSTRKFSNKQRWQHDTRTLNQHLPQPWQHGTTVPE